MEATNTNTTTAGLIVRIKPEALGISHDREGIGRVVSVSNDGEFIEVMSAYGDRILTGPRDIERLATDSERRRFDGRERSFPFGAKRDRSWAGDDLY